MGYTHYYSNIENLAPLSNAAMALLETVFSAHGGLVQFESDDARPPVVSRECIRFNGIGDDGHETFYWSPAKSFHFCKTARKEYDIVVCLVLLVLKKEYGKALDLGSDGGPDDWAYAFEECKSLLSLTPDQTWIGYE